MNHPACCNVKQRHSHQHIFNTWHTALKAQKAAGGLQRAQDRGPGAVKTAHCTEAGCHTETQVDIQVGARTGWVDPHTAVAANLLQVGAPLLAAPEDSPAHRGIHHLSKTTQVPFDIDEEKAFAYKEKRSRK